MSAVAVVATLTIAEGKNAEFEAAATEMMAAVSGNEPGNEFYSFGQSREDPQQYRVLERYVDKAALEAHGAADHFKAFGAKIGPLLAAPPKIEYLKGI